MELQPSTVFSRCSATTKWISHQDHNEKKDSWIISYFLNWIWINREGRSFLKTTLHPMDWIFTIFVLGANIWKKKVCNHLTCPGNTYFEYSSFLSDNNKLCLVSFCLFHKLSNNSNLPKWIIATFSNSPMNLFPEKKGIFVIPSTSSSRSCIIVALSSVTIHQYFFSGQPSHQLSEKLHFFSCCSYC